MKIETHFKTLKAYPAVAKYAIKCSKKIKSDTDQMVSWTFCLEDDVKVANCRLTNPGTSIEFRGYSADFMEAIDSLLEQLYPFIPEKAS